MYGQHTLAVARREGVDSSAPRDVAKAAVLFQLLAEQGEVHSLGWLAMMYFGGLGVPKTLKHRRGVECVQTSSSDRVSTCNSDACKFSSTVV
jgi:TPR repeat protein